MLTVGNPYFRVARKLTARVLLFLDVVLQLEVIEYPLQCLVDCVLLEGNEFFLCGDIVTVLVLSNHALIACKVVHAIRVGVDVQHQVLVVVALERSKYLCTENLYFSRICEYTVRHELLWVYIEHTPLFVCEVWYSRARHARIGNVFTSKCSKSALYETCVDSFRKLNHVTVEVKCCTLGDWFLRDEWLHHIVQIYCLEDDTFRNEIKVVLVPSILICLRGGWYLLQVEILTVEGDVTVLCP